MAADFGAEVRDKKTARGWSQKELAERADVSKPFISQLESGKTGVSQRVKARILAALEARPFALSPQLTDAERHWLLLWQLMPAEKRRTAKTMVEALEHIVATWEGERAVEKACEGLRAVEKACEGLRAVDPLAEHEPELVTVRLVGSIAAGDSWEPLEVPARLLGRYSPDYVHAMQVRGDSMIDHDIRGGEYLLLRAVAQRHSPGRDSVYVLEVQGPDGSWGLTAKHVRREPGSKLRLIADNPEHADRVVPLRGQVISVWRGEA